MNRPPLEVADIVRAAGKDFVEKQRSWLSGLHRKVLCAIKHCRTAALGGHRDCCSQCGLITTISYNSCRDRHCPKCQTHARDKWLAARHKELLPVLYLHVIFTLPRTLAPLFLYNKKLLYSLLFRTSAATLLEVAADPKHLGAEIGFFSVLHTWSQKLLLHPHVHCVIPAGGLSPYHHAWIQPRYRFFLPRGVLIRVFRGKFVDGLKAAYRKGQLCLPGTLQLLADPKIFRSYLRSLHRHQWMVYLKPPLAGPQHVLHYLARYTHRVAISNHRLVAMTDGKVTFRWKDYAHGNQQRLMTLTVNEFLRRFLLHTLPRSFVRIRSFGFMAHRRRSTLLPVCQQLLEVNSSWAEPRSETTQQHKQPTWFCPRCGGPMVVIQRFSAQQLIWESFKQYDFVDSS